MRGRILSPSPRFLKSLSRNLKNAVKNNCLLLRRVLSCQRMKRRRRKLRPTRRSLVDFARYCTLFLMEFIDFARLALLVFHPSLVQFSLIHFVTGDEGYLGQEDWESGCLQSPGLVPLLHCHITGNKGVGKGWFVEMKTKKQTFSSVSIFSFWEISTNALFDFLNDFKFWALFKVPFLLKIGTVVTVLLAHINIFPLLVWLDGEYGADHEGSGPEGHLHHGLHGCQEAPGD